MWSNPQFPGTDPYPIRIRKFDSSVLKLCQFRKIFVTTIWLFRGRIPKSLVVILDENKFDEKVVSDTSLHSSLGFPHDFGKHINWKIMGKGNKYLSQFFF